MTPIWPVISRVMSWYLGAMLTSSFSDSPRIFEMLDEGGIEFNTATDGYEN
jgi:hypothetical protein